MPQSSKRAEASSSKTRKRLRKRDPKDKRESRQEKLHRRLKQYADYDADKFRAAEHLPRVFHCGVVAKRACCTVVVNWDVVAEMMSTVYQTLAQRSEQWQSATESEVKKVKTSNKSLGLATAFTHVLPHLPRRFNQSLLQLCFEAAGVTIQKMSLMGSPSSAGEKFSVRELVDTLLKVQEFTIKGDLEIYGGPTPRFRDKTEYEQSLQAAAVSVLKEGKKLTQGSIAEELTKGCSDATLDEDTIKRWNKDFGVNWKAFKKGLEKGGAI